MIKDWVCLGSSRTGIDLEVKKGILAESHQIPAVIMNKKVSAYDLGVWELYVHKKDVEQAKIALEWN
jgi:hypothetical protein